MSTNTSAGEPLLHSPTPVLGVHFSFTKNQCWGLLFCSPVPMLGAIIAFSDTNVEVILCQDHPCALRYTEQKKKETGPKMCCYWVALWWCQGPHLRPSIISVDQHCFRVKEAAILTFVWAPAALMLARDQL